MRVLVYGMSESVVGGVEVYLTQMNLFMDENIVFDYIVEGTKCRFKDTIEDRGGHIFYVTNKTYSVTRNLRENKSILKRLRETHKVIYFNLISLSWIEPIRIALALGYRVYVHAHLANFVAEDFSHHFVYSVNKRRLSKWDVKRLACCEYAKEFMFCSTDEVEIIHNAVDINKFRFDEVRRNKIREELRIEKHENVIGFVGRFKKQKNPLILPKILKAVNDADIHDVKMIVLGEGELENQLNEMVKSLGLEDKILLLGVKENVGDYYQAMDVFILPSLHEGFPIVMVEAQTSGLRCVVSDNITREVNITRNVRFLPIDDVRLWGEMIKEILETDDCHREKWAEFMLNTHFNLRNEALRLEQILSS